MVSPQPAAEPRATVVATPSRLLRATALVMALFLAGAGGYRLVEGVPWWDAFYMTVITITTVGFGHVFPLSPAGEALTVALLGAGIGVSCSWPPRSAGRSWKANCGAIWDMYGGSA